MKTPRFFYGLLTGSLVLGCLALWPRVADASLSTNLPAGDKGKAGNPRRNQRRESASADSHGRFSTYH